MSIRQSIQLFLFISFFSSCSYFIVDDENSQILRPKNEVPTVVKPKSEKEIIFNQAEKYFNAGEFDKAFPLYFKIAREPSDSSDLIYEKSLLGLAQLYEKSDQSEKAILAYDELEKRNSNVLPRASLKIAQMKNHFRVTNYYQARQIKNDLDKDYKAQSVTLNDLYKALYYQTDIYYDRHIFDELVFLGEVQKYFVFVLEGEHTPESEKLADLLSLYYEKFIRQLDNPLLSSNIKQKLIISLLDQLSKFDRYKLANKQESSLNLDKFSKFAEKNQAKLTERLANGKF